MATIVHADLLKDRVSESVPFGQENLPSDPNFASAVAALRNFAEDLQLSQEEERTYLRSCQRREELLTKLREKMFRLAVAPIAREEPPDMDKFTGSPFASLADRSFPLEATLIERHRLRQLAEEEMQTQRQRIGSLLVRALLDRPRKPIDLQDPTQLEHTDDAFRTENMTVRRRFTSAFCYLYPRIVAYAASLQNGQPLFTYMPPMTVVFMKHALLGQKFQVKKQLPQGNGGFLSVVELDVEGARRDVVLKQWIRPESQTREQMMNLCLANGATEHFVPLLAMGPNEMFIEYFPLGDLLERLADLRERDFRPIALDIVKIMVYLHEKGYGWNDLKAENLLLAGDQHVVACDLEHVSQDRDRFIGGTPFSMAPEVFLGGPVNNQQMDVFAFGIILFEYLNDSYDPEESVFLDLKYFESSTGQTFPPEWKRRWDSMQQIDKARNCRTKDGGKFFELLVRHQLTDEKYKAELARKDSTGRLRELALRCLSIRPQERPSAQEILSILSSP